ALVTHLESQRAAAEGGWRLGSIGERLQRNLAAGRQRLNLDLIAARSRFSTGSNGQLVLLARRGRTRLEQLRLVQSAQRCLKLTDRAFQRAYGGDLSGGFLFKVGQLGFLGRTFGRDHAFHNAVDVDARANTCYACHSLYLVKLTTHY